MIATILIVIGLWLALGTFIVFIASRIQSWLIDSKDYFTSRLINALVEGLSVINFPATIIVFPATIFLGVILFLYALVS